MVAQIMAVSEWLRVFIISPFPIGVVSFTPSRTSGNGAVTGNFRKTSVAPKPCGFLRFMWGWLCSDGLFVHIGLGQFSRCGGCRDASSGNLCRLAGFCRCGMCCGTVPRRRWILASIARWWRWLPAAFDTVINSSKPIDAKLWRAFKPLLAALCSPQQLSREPFHAQLRSE